MGTLQGAQGHDEALVQGAAALGTLIREAERLLAVHAAGAHDPPAVARLLAGAEQLWWLLSRLGLPDSGADLPAAAALPYNPEGTPDEAWPQWERDEAWPERERDEAWPARERDEERVPPGEHTLPPLPYAYEALEPHIDTQTMRLHHDRHHKSYVDGLNKAERMMEKARESGDFDLLRHWEREAAFHGSGHYLHTLFWEIMGPQGGGEPEGRLAKAIARDFGSFAAFRRHFAAAAEQAEGVGWALLCWAPRPRRLVILQAEKHQLFAQWDVVPVLVLDVWEHAYYLKYQTDRRAYVNAWWNVVNWANAGRRFERARRLEWAPA